MTELSFKYDLFPGNVDQERKCKISNHVINANWTLIIHWWSPYDQMSSLQSRPEFLEIRQTTSREILISGTFKFMCNEVCVLQKKFKQFLEADSPTMLMLLKFSDNDAVIFDPYEFSHLRRNGHKEYSISGTLKIFDGSEQEENTKGGESRSLKELSNDLKLLLGPKETYFSDVNLKCGTELFPAHKNILCARSPVFAAMLTTEMKESIENKVNITDLSPHVLKTLLTYIYSGETGALSVQSAGELLFAADKYQLQDLKRVCSYYLKSSVAVGNVLKTLVLGDLHDEDLKVFAIDFICNSCEEFEALEKTVEWKNLRQKRPSLAMDVLTGLVKSKDQILKQVNRPKTTKKIFRSFSLQDRCKTPVPNPVVRLPHGRTPTPPSLEYGRRGTRDLRLLGVKRLSEGKRSDPSEGGRLSAIE